MSEIQNEVDRNYAAFIDQLPALMAAHREQYALIKDAKILSFYSSAQDAVSAANAFIPDKVYSVQQVTDAAIDLGFYTDAVPVD